MLTTQKIQIYYYFEFPTRHPYKMCWFEFWVRRPKRLALVAATAQVSEGAADAAAATTAGKAGFRGRSGGGDRGGCRTDVQKYPGLNYPI